ncbi:MAG TPA: PQQ-binding-like beta-propeller repeat protein [Lacipirellulaceae bacterium]|nr:PQQ-binding-like beta-propeller repeat protein [Lacipirellulaceae bacterium]
MSTAELVSPPEPAPARNFTPWPGAIIVLAYWLAHAAIGMLDISGSERFFYRLPVLLVALLAFLGWWIFNRRLSRGERWSAIGGAVLAATLSLVLRDDSIHGPLMVGVIGTSLRALMTGWALWLVAVSAAMPGVRRWGMVAVAMLAWGWGLAVRVEGLTGQAGPAFFPRWTLSSEEKFAAERVAARDKRDAADAAAQEPLVAAPGDWTGFRGPARDGAVRGVTFSTDWQKAPPKQLWKRRVGPGWSSLTVVADRVFTQEQRGENEAVVCYDAATGDEIWSHEDPGRFDEAMGGVGPRATPEFAGGLIYALGANGVLNCLDAATGGEVWQRNIADDAKLGVPYWGFAGSPLVVDGKVIVFAGASRGGGHEQPAKDPTTAIDPTPASANQEPPTDSGSLIAYDSQSGDIAWRADAGGSSYSSPQLLERDGRRQILFTSDAGLIAFDPATGESVWRLPSNAKDGAPNIQPHSIGGDEMLVSFNGEGGVVRFQLTHENGQYRAHGEQEVRSLKPFFNDFVQSGDALYGFDGSVFCSVDAKTGKRNWKKGRYGSGQVLLVADAPVLVVLSEQGEAVLVAADPQQHRELGKFPAIEGKTWNHPTIVGRRLFVRNAEQMACFELAPR